jgi:hypothetical protein
LAGTRNSAETERGRAEMVQNGRVLNEHLLRHVAQALRITAMSEASDTDGHLEFEAPDGGTYRYEIDHEYVAFGPPGDLAALAGPVRSLQFTCYDANDFSEPNETPEVVRLVTWEATLGSPGALTPDKTVTGACHLRANTGAMAGHETHYVTYDFSNRLQNWQIWALDGEGKPQTPSVPLWPLDLLWSADYDDLEAEDDAAHTTAVASNSNYAQIRFVVRIDEDEGEVGEITAAWTGRGVNAHSARADGASLYIWNAGDTAYELLEMSEDSENELTLTGSKDESLSDYVGGLTGDQIRLLVVSNDRKTANQDNVLHSDYLKVDVADKAGMYTVLP